MRLFKFPSIIKPHLPTTHDESTFRTTRDKCGLKTGNCNGDLHVFSADGPADLIDEMNLAHGAIATPLAEWEVTLDRRLEDDYVDNFCQLS